MKAYNLYFNPEKKEDIYFSNFYFSPSSRKKRRFGSLYIFGQLKSSKEDERLLEKIAYSIKEEYYEDPNLSIEDSLNKALNRANDLLEEKDAREINIAVFVITDDLSFFFSLCGDMEIFLGRGEEFFDFDESVDMEITPSYSFSTILRGQLEEDDRLILLNECLLEYLAEKEMIQKIPYIKKEEQMEIFLKNKKTLKRLFGSMLFVFVKKPKKSFFLTPSFLRKNSEFSSVTFSSLWFSSSTDFRRKIKRGVFFTFLFVSLLAVAYFLF